MGMKWLITGGCGFIGTSLIAKLVEMGGHQIWVIDNLSVGSREDLASVTSFDEVEGKDVLGGMKLAVSPACQLITGDILDQHLAEAVCEGMDVVVHLAANTGVGPSVEDPRQDCLNNVMGIFNYLEAARLHKVEKFIFASSGAPVGEVEPPIHEELAAHPVSPYGASKLAGEGYCSAYFQTFKVKTISLRFGNVYGPRSGHKNSVVAKFIRNAMSGEGLEIYGDGTQTRDFIYIDDLLNAVLLAANSEVGGEVFQIATHRETTLNELAQKLKETFHRLQPNIDFTVGHAAPRLGDVNRNFSDTRKAQKMLGWQCQWTLDNGLVETLQWFLAQEQGGCNA